jgi:cobalamin-dependent methionine synthase I
MRNFSMPEKSLLQPFVYSPVHTIYLLLVAALVLPQFVRAECKEYKIVEYEDRVEAVCVGEPLTEAQKKANLEDEKRQELEARRQRAEEVKRQTEAEAAEKARAAAEAAAELKNREIKPVTPPKSINKNSTTSPQILFK